MHTALSTSPRTIPRGRVSHTTTTCAASPGGKTPPNGDAWATKYCFCARSAIRTSSEGPKKCVGVIFGYDRSPEVSSHVQDMSKHFREETGYDVDDVELVMHQECPVELTGDVYIQFFDEGPLDGHDEDQMFL